MKNFKKVLFSLLAATAMWSCSDDKMGPDAPNQLPEEQGEGFYMALDIQMPTGNTGSRSQTTDKGESTDGTEVGSDAENTVSSALIVLAAKDDISATIKKYGFIAAGEVQSNNISGLTSATDSKQYRAKARIQKTNLNNLYEALGNTGVAPEVYVFVFCNPTKELTDMFSAANTTLGSAEWIDKTCSVIQGSADKPNENVGIWGANSFLMNNVKLTTRQLPAKLLDWENFNTIDKPFHLSEINKVGETTVDNSSTVEGRGAVKVERSVARFDFKDGSPADTEANTYNVLYYTNADGNIDDKKPLVKVELQRMALVNMANKFYYLPRVSADGHPTGNDFAICGTEKGWVRDDATGLYSAGNYVVGPYSTVFGGNTVETDFTNYFNYPFFENDGTFNNATMAGNRWNVYKIEDVLAGAQDNYKPDVKYHVWRYVTENALPVGPEKQMNGVSTGVVFKGRMLGTDKALTTEWQSWNKNYIKNVANCLNGKAFEANGQPHDPIKGNSTDDPILYYFNGHLYMTWNHIRQAAIQASVTIGTGGTMEINRSNSLYKAVFGDGPIPAGFKYIVSETEEKDVVDSQWKPGTEDWEQSDAYKAWTESADYAWTQWSATKPTEGQLLNTMREKVTGAGITIYQSSVSDDGVPGYYCYYYYWNRHNDNGIAGVMGPMEFAVVRNNVYKLSVDKISRLGHPRIPGNDPDKPTPGTPDESDEIYLDVTVDIVPWSVRINKIEF